MKQMVKMCSALAVLFLFFNGSSIAHDERVTIISQPVVTAQIGRLYEYDVDAISSNPGGIIAYSLHDGPAGMTINSITG